MNRHFAAVVQRMTTSAVVSNQVQSSRYVYKSHILMTAPSSLCIRTYRGDSSDAVPTLSAEEEALLKVAKPKADAIFERHIKLPVVTDEENKNNEEMALEVRRKRLIYRSKQRGWLEVDLLLGTWANENVPSLNSDELDQFEAFVNMETIDIYNVITLRLDVPENMKRSNGTGVVEKIQEWARSSPLGKADPDQYKSVKTKSKLI